MHTSIIPSAQAKVCLTGARVRVALQLNGFRAPATETGVHLLGSYSALLTTGLDPSFTRGRTRPVPGAGIVPPWKLENTLRTHGSELSRNELTRM